MSYTLNKTGAQIDTILARAASGGQIDQDIAAEAAARAAADLLKAPLASPALTGTPTAPTAAPGTDTTQLATTAFANAAAAAAAASAASGKADKVAGATAGNLAGLDASGNLTDAGIAAADVATKDDVQNITPKRTASNDPANSSFSVLCDTALAGQAKAKLYGKSAVINQLVDSDTSSVTPFSGRKYYTKISGTEGVVNSDGTAFSVTGGTDEVVDLTAIFTAAELTAIGTSVANLKAAWLKKYGYPLPQYIPYDAGSIVSNNATYQMHGRNLWDEEWESGIINGLTGTDTTSSSGAIRGKHYYRVHAGAAIYARNPVSDDVYIFAYDANKEYIGRNSSDDHTWVKIGGANYGANRILYLPENAAYIRIAIGATNSVYREDVCVNFSDTSFNGNYEAWYDGGSVTADNLNGIETAQDTQTDGDVVRKTKKVTFDNDGDPAKVGGISGWADTYGSTNQYGIRIFSLVNTNAKSGGESINSFGKVFQARGSSISEEGVGINNNTGADVFVAVLASRLATVDVAGFRTWLAANPIDFCYELATPTTEPVTPASLTTQKGYNSLDPVSGDVQSADAEVEYDLDIVGYVDNKFAEPQALVLENI